MAFTIDTTSYPKNARFSQRHGYQLRGTTPTAIVIHTTNNSRRGTAFEGEAKYLLESADVSAHFLIAKDGRIVRFLEPRAYQAWHVGEAVDAFVNSKSIGIELHTSVGETPTQAQKDACAWLCRQLMTAFQIPATMIETHRKVARPVGRKSDPVGWPDDEFYRWRAGLAARPSVVYTFPGLPVYRTPMLIGEVAVHIPDGAIVEIDATGEPGYSAFAGHVKRAVFEGRELREPGFVDTRLLKSV